METPKREGISSAAERIVDSFVKSKRVKCSRLGSGEGVDSFFWVFENGSRRSLRKLVSSDFRAVQIIGRVVDLKRCWAMARDRPEEAGEQRMKFVIDLDRFELRCGCNVEGWMNDITQRLTSCKGFIFMHIRYHIQKNVWKRYR